MASKTRKSIDEAKAYVNTMDAKTLWDYFIKTENYRLEAGKALAGFMPDWIGEFYAYYQWYYNLSSAELIKKIPVSFWKRLMPDFMIWNLIWQYKKWVKCDACYLLSQRRRRKRIPEQLVSLCIYA